ncbi:LysR family transcriptional regulator [bacterium]|nr:LysR family transcriptional regulator [bacterium]
MSKVIEPKDMNPIECFHQIHEFRAYFLYDVADAALCGEVRMDLEIRHLRLVDAIAREGGITGASKQLYLTQSALSHQLREIEDRLGTPLFLRLRRTMILTEAGKRVLLSARAVLAELQAAEEDVRRLGRGKDGILRISTQCNTCYHWLPALIQKFEKVYQGVDVQINVDATKDPLRALWKGELDLAIAFSIPDPKGLTLYPLFVDELMATMQPDHRLSSREYLKAGDFAEENLIVYAVPREEMFLFQRVLTPASVSPRKVTHVMLTEAIIEMVKAGLGISVLARWFTAPYIRDGYLKTVRITKKGLTRKWIAVSLSHPHPPPFIQAFARLLAESSMPVVEVASRQKRSGSVPRFYAIS